MHWWSSVRWHFALFDDRHLCAIFCIVSLALGEQRIANFFQCQLTGQNVTENVKTHLRGLTAVLGLNPAISPTYSGLPVLRWAAIWDGTSL
jgi:hypothetical protein